MTNIQEKIYVINKIGFHVVEIDKRFYQYSKFEPFEANVSKSILIGKDIMNLLTDSSLSIQKENLNQQQEAIRTSIENLSQVSLEFSNHYRWKTYLASF